ncbi:MAG: type II secretion system protein GspG [Phycisphaerales bacterium]
MTSRAESGRARRRDLRRAFSVIEVMIVLAIMLLLAGIVGITVFGQKAKADIQTTKVQMESIESALRAFRLDFRRYPTEDEGIAVLWDRSKLDPDADESIWSGYLEKPVAADVWGSAWGYSTQTDDFTDTSSDSSVPAEPTFDLWSFGPDREDGTDDDIHLNATASDDEGSDGGGLLPPPDSGGG